MSTISENIAFILNNLKPAKMYLILRSTFIMFFCITISCTHDPSLSNITPISSYKNVTPTCANCPTDLVCAQVDDITITGSTTFSSCTPQPAGQGIWTMDASFCATWTPNGNQTEIVTTCIIACNESVCDTTFFTIFPPIPADTITGNPCNPDVIYFEKDVLPILSASCAYSGCHNAASRKEGVILDNYDNTLKTGGVKAGNLSKSELYKVITKSDSEDAMPPIPSPRLTQAEINIIASWILQGAKNETCDFNALPCDTNNISYSKYVKIALASCTACHKTGNVGGGINLDSYAGVKSAADSGRLYGSINWSTGYVTMPQGSSKLADCTVSKIKSWIDAGAPNN